jgi:hypothetical protein
MEIRGRIHKIENTQDVSPTFKKRGFVLVLDGQYPQYPYFEFTQDRVVLLEGYQPGDEVEVNFDINGREWTSPQGEVKYFNTLRAYQIKKIELVSPTVTYGSTPSQTPATQTNHQAPPATNIEGDDDLPF